MPLTNNGLKALVVHRKSDEMTSSFFFLKVTFFKMYSFCSRAAKVYFEAGTVHDFVPLNFIANTPRGAVQADGIFSKAEHARPSIRILTGVVHQCVIVAGLVR